MRKSFFLVLLFLSVYVQIKSQIIIEQSVDDIEVDLQGNIYLLKGSTISKYNSLGELKFTYGNAIYGSIAAVDVTDPLRILLFFKESNTIIFLNQQLAEINDPVDLSTISDIEPIVASYASGGGFWVFDAMSMTLIQYNSQGINQAQTENLAGYLNAQIPIGLNEYKQNLYLQLPNRILVFDLYGNYLKSIPFKTEQKIRLNGFNYQFLKDGKLIKGNLQSFTQSELLIENANLLLDVMEYRSLMYLLYKDKVVIEPIKP